MEKPKKAPVDISLVSVSLVRANMTEPQFLKWCESHNWIGDLKKKYTEVKAAAVAAKKK